jgi:hypothetical protein
MGAGMLWASVSVPRLEQDRPPGVQPHMGCTQACLSDHAAPPKPLGGAPGAAGPLQPCTGTALGSWPRTQQQAGGVCSVRGHASPLPASLVAGYPPRLHSLHTTPLPTPHPRKGHSQHSRLGSGCAAAAVPPPPRSRGRVALLSPVHSVPSWPRRAPWSTPTHQAGVPRRSQAQAVNGMSSTPIQPHTPTHGEGTLSTAKT